MRSRLGTTPTIIFVYITTAGGGGVGGGHVQDGADPGCEGVQPSVDPR